MKKIILASTSPRRREILSKYNINLEIMSSDVDEKVLPDEEPIQVAMALAFQKAHSIASKLDDNCIVLAADTIVFKEEILGKPTDDIDAYEMLNKLNGHIHQVITGIAIIDTETNKKIVDYEITNVKLKKLTKDKIKRYINTGEFKDKAGSYGIQGYGETLVEWIEGSYSNVVGLPIAKIDSIFDNMYNINLL
ncbi:nucleoside triphosphate pyrophosphatase [Brassicibacter mesophilus]|uniref:nucleoside triphosphate pyrophosphatase n=1 Tax=Brassicibacter mesophilus TaxID=745119 RepID=UPI003D234058